MYDLVPLYVVAGVFAAYTFYYAVLYFIEPAPLPTHEHIERDPL